MKHLLLVVFISCFGLLPLIAQIQNARIEGNVQDTSGATIPGTKVLLINLRTQAKLETQSEASGFYFFPSLQPGFYTLVAEAKGFRKESVNNIEVTVGETIRQDLKLEVGTLNETVTVEASNVRVQTSEATIQRAVTLRDRSEERRVGKECRCRTWR